MSLQVLLKYNMQRGVAVIPKATCEQHLAENITDMFNWRLSNQQKVRQARMSGLLSPSSLKL
jgi:diketogulonate reductase-like aldo/keto reductase